MFISAWPPLGLLQNGARLCIRDKGGAYISRQVFCVHYVLEMYRYDFDCLSTQHCWLEEMNVNFFVTKVIKIF